jgi:hypothetical protein
MNDIALGRKDTMRLEDALGRAQATEALEVMRPHWEESAASLGKDAPSFLQASEFLDYRRWCGFEPEVDAPLQEAAWRILADPALRHLAWHCHQLLYEHTDYNEMRRWPPLDKALGDLGGALYLLVALALTPRVLAVHRKMGVPDEVTRESLSQVCRIAGNYRRMTGGRLGVTLNTLYWLRHYTAGRLFRIGRMEYMIQPWDGSVEVYRRRETGEVIALAPNGTRLNAAGYVDGTGGVFDTERGWTARLVADAEAVAGCPISPLGMALRREVRLPTAAWECALKKGDLSLQMHIPGGGGMSLERCGDSMRRAVPFFRGLFPAQPFRAVTCVSWIFNTQFEQIRLSSENLVRYQRELYLFPVPSSGKDGLWFIFLRDPVDPATAPRDTSLQRGVADFLAAGNTWRGGGMFFMAEHLDHFGTQYYRSHWPPAGLGL